MDWQAWIAALIVLAATVWLLSQGWRTIRQGLRQVGEMPGCGRCPKRRSGKSETPLIQLGEKTSSERR